MERDSSGFVLTGRGSVQGGDQGTNLRQIWTGLMMIVQHWCQQQEICAANLPPWGDEGKKICLVSS